MSINTLAHVFVLHENIVYTANDSRQTLCIFVAGTIALSISAFYNVQYGVFFVAYPLVLPSLAPVFNHHVTTRFVFSAVVSCVGMVLIVSYLSQWPLVMTPIVFGLYATRFHFMSKGPLFPLDSMGVVCQNTVLNFMSYPTTNWHTLMSSNMEACVMAVALSALLHYPILGVEPHQPPPRIEKDVARACYKSLFSGTAATMIFVVFQVCDLSGSLPALMAGISILFPMHYHGVVISLVWRVVGAVLTCLYIPLAQLLICDFGSHMLPMTPLIGLGLVFSARLHIVRKVGAGVGFTSITTIGVMSGQNLHSDQDLVFSDLYRITSITFALVAALTVVFLVHWTLSCFAATQFIITE